VKRIALLAALAFASSMAFAHTCPKLMKQIDDALPKATGKTAAQMNEVKDLRMKGEELHKAGKHAESEAALKKALGILGVK
jgi:hypothetical protein